MVMAISRFERLFRESASLDIDKSDIKRLEDFINQRLYDLLIMGQAAAKANERDVIQRHDLPITPGLKQSIREFRDMDETLDLALILEHLAKLPPLELAYSEELEQKIPEIVGGLTISLAKVFRTLWPSLKNPSTPEWEKVEKLYAILL